jgi:hypothetical protein
MPLTHWYTLGSTPKHLPIKRSRRSHDSYQSDIPLLPRTSLYVHPPSLSLHFTNPQLPQGYSIVGELPASRLRSRSIVLGRFFYLVSAIIGTQLRARMITATAWNWGAKSAFFWLGCNIICMIWTFFRLPETGGFSFADLDILFANRVPTRKFKQYTIRRTYSPVFVVYLLIRVDEVAEGGEELEKIEKVGIQHVEDVEGVNHEIVDDIAVIEPVPGRVVVNV